VVESDFACKRQLELYIFGNVRKHLSYTRRIPFGYGKDEGSSPSTSTIKVGSVSTERL